MDLMEFYYIVQVVVKVDAAGTEVTSQQRGVCRENRRHLHAPQSQQNQTDSGQPFVEVGHDARCWTQPVGLVFQKRGVVELITKKNKKNRKLIFFF